MNDNFDHFAVVISVVLVAVVMFVWRRRKFHAPGMLVLFGKRKGAASSATKNNLDGAQDPADGLNHDDITLASGERLGTKRGGRTSF